MYVCIYVYMYIYNMYIYIYIFILNSGFARFYMLPKIYKRSHNVPGRPVISNYIKDTNHFLKKLKELGSLPKNAILSYVLMLLAYILISHMRILPQLENT